MTYAYEIRRNPATGETVFDDTTGSPDASDSPMREVVLMALRTTKGECLADPEMGVEWAKVAKATTGVDATAVAVITAALQRHVRSGEITNLRVTAEVKPATGQLLFNLTFTDPRLARRDPIRIQGQA